MGVRESGYGVGMGRGGCWSERRWSGEGVGMSRDGVGVGVSADGVGRVLR